MNVRIRLLLIATALLAAAATCGHEKKKESLPEHPRFQVRPGYDHDMGSIKGSLPRRGGPVTAEGTSRHIQNVPLIHQMPRYPTGCEAVSMTMLLQWAGLDITTEDVIRHMPRGPKPATKDGVLHAPDPREAFIGNPYDDKGSFGIYHEPLLAMLDLYFPGKAVNLTGLPWEKIEAHVASGIPVVIWGTIKMLPSKPTLAWRTPSGDSFQWIGNEHAMTMVGFDDIRVFVNDPYTGKLEKYDKIVFIERWNSLSSQAISITVD